MTIAPDRHAIYSVCDVPIAALTPAGAADLIVSRAVSGGRFEVHLCNSYTLSLAGDDPQLNEALLRANLNLPDGTPVAWFGRRKGTQGPVRGPGLVTDVATRGVAHNLKHFLYGGAEGVAQDMKFRLEVAAPGIDVVGVDCPPWVDLDNDGLNDLAGRIISSGADIVWIGLGTPRQDYLVAKLAPLVECMVIPVGAAFDFLAGRVDEAHPLLHGSGLEWLHRFAQEPKRLWRRYLFGNPKFLVRAVSSHRRS